MNNLEKKISYIPVSALEFDPDLPRRFFNDERVKEMSDSIKEKGILQPLLVREKKGDPGKYSVVIGKMRLKSSLSAGYVQVPCIIENVEDKEALEIALVENIQRSDLTPFEEAWGILKLIKAYNYSIEQVVQKIGRSHNFVNVRLKLLSLPEEIQKYVADGKLGIAEAASLVHLNPEKRSGLVKEIASGSLSRDQVKEVIFKKTQESKEKITKAKERVAPQKIKSQAKILTELLEIFNCDKVGYNTKVDIKIILLKLQDALDKVLKQLEKVHT